jgi:UDP-glucose 4-epimerase
MTRKVLITGASGFIGSSLARHLAQSGWQVVAAARNPASVPAGAGIETAVQPDLDGALDWMPLLAGVSHVVHLAGIAHRGDADAAAYDRVIRAASERLATVCRQHGIARLIYMSSIGAQAGSSAPATLSERDEPRPVTSYDRAKLAAEAAIRQSGAEFTILRPVLVYGPGVKGNMALLMRLARSPWPLPFARFDNRRSLVSLANLNDAIAFCLDAEGARNQLFVVADEAPVSLAEMIATLRDAIGRPARMFAMPPSLARSLLLALGRGAMWERIGGGLIVDSGKLMRAGWRPRVVTAEGLRAMMRATYPQG